MLLLEGFVRGRGITGGKGVDHYVEDASNDGCGTGKETSYCCAEESDCGKPSMPLAKNASSTRVVSGLYRGGDRGRSGREGGI